MKDKAIQMLLDTLSRTKMYAYTKEALLMRASIILELVSDDIDIHAFRLKHVKNGEDLSKPYSDQWAKLLIVDALELLNEKI